MPKEQIWGDLVTVRDGDVAVMRSRCRADLVELGVLPDPADDPAGSPGAPLDVDLLRRRLQLLSQLVEATAEDVVSAGVSTGDAVHNFEVRHAALTAQLDGLREPTADARTGTAPTAPTDGDARSEPQRRVQQTLDVQWGRDEGVVRLFTAAWDHDRGEPVDLGGHWVALDWVAVNKLIRKLKTARDQSCGVPE